MEISGFVRFTGSNLPPIPISKIARSKFDEENIKKAARVAKSKYVN